LHAATRRRAKGKPCQRTRCRSVTTAPRISISSGRKSPRSAAAIGSRESSVSHDTDKLIRQLSLVAFLMAELRPLTARDIKGNVEGYQEMSDEAFARRFYSDRASSSASACRSIRSAKRTHTGEELYTLRSERYFLPPLELDDDELAALQTSLYLLEGRFAYSEPLRLALQNLALGRPAGVRAAAPTSTAERVEVRDPDYTPELQGRLGKARRRDHQAAHRALPLLVDRPRRRNRAHDQPVRAASRRTARGT